MAARKTVRKKGARKATKKKAIRKKAPKKSRETLKVKDVIDALEASAGIQTTAAAKLKIHRNTLKKYIERHDEIAIALESITERELDLAESKLLGAIREGNLTAVIFYLKCKGKKRGYVERQELTGAGGQPISITGAKDRLLDRLEDMTTRAGEVAGVVG